MRSRLFAGGVLAALMASVGMAQPMRPEPPRRTRGGAMAGRERRAPYVDARAAMRAAKRGERYLRMQERLGQRVNLDDAPTHVYINSKDGWAALDRFGVKGEAAEAAAKALAR